MGDSEALQTYILVVVAYTDFKDEHLVFSYFFHSQPFDSASCLGLFELIVSIRFSFGWPGMINSIFWLV